MRRTRLGFQAAFLALIAVALYRGVNCEAWCPFGGVELLATYIPRGTLTCSLASSNLYTILCLLGLTLIARRAFCGWVCPLGALGEWSGRLGDRLFGSRRDVPRRVDVALSGLKYLLLALILTMTYTTGELFFRGFDPCYALISLHGHEITFVAYVVLGALLVGSLVVHVPFCRWLCPLAAVLNPISRFGLLRVAQDPETCTGCSMCDKACPTRIPVSKVTQVTQARCISCLECVAGCPRKGGRAVDLRLPFSSRRLHWGLIPVLVVLAAAGSALLSEAFPFPTLTQERGAPPSVALSRERFDVEGLRCRKSSEAFCELIFGRLDEFSLQGYLKVECYPAPGTGQAVVFFEDGRADRQRIIDAFTRPEVRLQDMDLNALAASPGAAGAAGKPTGFRSSPMAP